MIVTYSDFQFFVTRNDLCLNEKNSKNEREKNEKSTLLPHGFLVDMWIDDCLHR